MPEPIQFATPSCPGHLETLHDYEVELEKVRGEMKALAARVAVFEGFINSTSTRFHTRLDGIEEKIEATTKALNTENTTQQKEIETLKLHWKYIGGIAAALVFILNYLDKIVKFFKP